MNLRVAALPSVAIGACTHVFLGEQDQKVLDEGVVLVRSGEDGLPREEAVLGPVEAQDSDLPPRANSTTGSWQGL